jgi:hypothetical protein
MLCPFGRRIPDLNGKKLTLIQKQWLADQILNGRFSAKELALKTQIPISTFFKWLSKIRNGQKLIANGRPSSIAEEHLPKIVDFINSSKTSISASDFDDEVYKYAILSAQERKNIAESQVKRPSPRTLLDLEKKLQIKTGNAELTTNARAIACADVRNAVSMCAAQHLMVPLVDHYLILNMDATQYTVGNNSKQKAKVKYLNRPTMGKSLQARKDSTNSGSTAFFIKHYLLISAAGYAADPVYIIADDNMGKEELDVHTVFGLGHGIGIGNKGYVVFSKTRSVNLKFYLWFNNTILVQFIKELKTLRNLGLDSLTWFQLDGEAQQIECYQSPELLQLLTDARIVVGKPAASTTEISQPCDAGDCFKATKTRVKNTTDADVIMDTHMLEKLTSVYDNHMRTTGAKKMPPNHVKMGKLGLLRVQLASKSSVTSRTVKDSFTRAGIYDVVTNQYSPRTILSNCTSAISKEEEVQIMGAIPDLSAILNRQGELLDSDFDACHIRENDAVSSKDNLIISRKRMVLLTNPALVERQEIKRRQKREDELVNLQKKRVRKEKADMRKAAKLAKEGKSNRVAVRNSSQSEDDSDCEE